MMELLKEELDRLNFPSDEKTLFRFQRYMELVLEWNEKVNMTGIKDPVEFEQKHFVDSILCAEFSGMEQIHSVIDVGTGAGLPGIPLAMIYPDKEFLLMDSLNKRMKILDEIKTELGLKNVTVLHGRAEDIAHQKEYREKFDLCVSRAVAKLSVLSEYCLPFVKVGGYFAPYKTVKASEELSEGHRSIEILGGAMEDVVLSKRGFDHQILFIKKMNTTLPKYPRKAGTPEKSPLK